MPQGKSWRGRIHLAIAPTKVMDRVEWLAEKITEIGFDEMSFLNCKFSERKVMRTVRLDKIVVAAVKQSRKPWKPIINQMIQFKDFVSQPRVGRKFIAHCYDEIERTDLFDELNKTNEEEEITIMVGPEGDFSIDEVRLAIKNGYESISLEKAVCVLRPQGLLQ